MVLFTLWSVTSFWFLPMPFVLPVSGAFCIQAALHICKEHHQWLFADLQVLVIAECIIQALNEGSILAMFVHTCLSSSGMSICTHLHPFALTCMIRNSCVMCTDDGGRGKRRTVLLDNGGCGGQRCWSSKMYMFCGVKCWMQPTVGDTGKEKATKSMYKRSQEGKKRTRESAKEKSTLRRVFTSHAGINYTHFYVRFNRSPFWARTIKIICDTCSTWPTNAHIRTCTARHEASCACVLLVIASFLGSPTPELWRWEECGIVISKKPEQKGNSFVLFLVYMTPTVT